MTETEKTNGGPKRRKRNPPLSVKKIERLKGPCRVHDQYGLYLKVTENGAAHWLFRYVMNGRERWLGLGGYQTFNLKEARERARLARQQVRNGTDPIDARRAKRAEATTATRPTITFREAAKQFNALHEKKWKNRKSRIQFQLAGGVCLPDHRQPHRRSDRHQPCAPMYRTAVD